jgi:histidinol-phosphate aminotransferase
MNHSTRAISRRRFGKLFGAGAALVAARPVVSLAGIKTAAPPGRGYEVAAFAAEPGVIRLSANENPYGPSPMALRAMTDAFSVAGRYPDDSAEVLVETVARINGVSRDHVLLGNGSGEILKVCAAAFTGPLTSNSAPAIQLAPRSRGGATPAFTPGRGKLIVADPTFEAILNHALVSGAEVVKIPLTGSFAHDLAKMSAAANQGLIYICNPNNPTASITPKNEIRELLENTSPRTTILIDEAYFHYADSTDYESAIPLVRSHPNLIVARTFSKIYGMAGLRCGYCIAQPKMIERLRPHQTWDSLNVMAAVAAAASLSDADQLKQGRQRNRETKEFTLGELEKIGYQSIPSEANFIMIDLRRPVSPVIKSLRERRVKVGSLFPTLQNHLRVTIGKRPEMETFLTEFRQVMNQA